LSYTILRLPRPPLFPYTTLFRSGVIVDRRDQVLITCGRWDPARTRSTILRMPLSIQGPFLTERGMALRFRISKFEFRNYFTLRSDRKSTRLNSSHVSISYAVFCL